MSDKIRDVVINGIAGSYLCPRKIRRVIYMLCGIKTETSRISPHCFFGGNKITIGKNTFVNYNNFFDLSDKITIGENVRIAMCSRFITSTHEIGQQDMRGGIKNFTHCNRKWMLDWSKRNGSSWCYD